MAKKIKGIKKKDHEKLSDANVKHVIDLLSKEKPITKKEACAILNISYNTTRLQTIIDNYITRKETEKRNRERNRGKPASEDEIQQVIKSYLAGTTVTDIAKSLYRSATFVKAIIEKLGVPQKRMGDDKHKVALLPEECIANSFKPGQIVWSAVYHAPCQVIAEVIDKATDYNKKYGCPVYRIYVIEHMDEIPEFYPNVSVGGFNAYSAAYDLGSLEHLTKYNVNL